MYVLDLRFGLWFIYTPNWFNPEPPYSYIYAYNTPIDICTTYLYIPTSSSLNNMYSIVSLYTCIWYYEIWAFSQHLIFPKIYHTAWTRTARTGRGRKSSSSTRVSWRASWTLSMWRINFHSVSFLQCHFENVDIDVCQFLQWQFLFTSWAARPNCVFFA